MSADQKIVNFRVKGEPPVQAGAALYSNFLGVSRVGTEVQFEFIFLDLNQLAMMVEQMKAAAAAVVPEVEGRTVAKIVMPAVSFIQVREQFEKIYAALREMGLVPQVPEVSDEHRDSATRVG